MSSAGTPVTLSNWHRLGRIAQGLSLNRSETYGQKTLEALAELVGCSSQVVGKARKFARLYPAAAQAASLEATVTWEQLQRIVAIGDAGIRRNLLNGCSSKNWSVRQLEREIRRRAGRQRPFGRGGRPSRRPQSLQEALTDFDRLATGIVHWYRALEPEEPADSERSSGLFDLDQIPPQLRRRITDAVESSREFGKRSRGRWRRGLAKRPDQQGGEVSGRAS